MIFPVMCVKSGQCVAFPDVCMTPGVLAGGPGPIPYPSIAIPADGDGTSKVKTENSNTLRKGDQMSKSQGDNAGTLGGLISRTFMGKVIVATGSNKVKAVGKEVAYHTVFMKHNGANPNNPAGGHVLPTNVKVKVVGTPGCPGRGIDALINGGMIAVGALVASGVAPIPKTGDPVTDAQQSLRCSPGVQQDIKTLGDPNKNPKANGFDIGYNFSQNGTFYGSGGGIVLGQSWYNSPLANPQQLTGIISHELGHAMSDLKGTAPNHAALPGETQGQFANRLTNEKLREEGRAAMRNIEARREAEKNCPNQPPPAINGDNGNFQAAANQPDPEGAVGQQFANCIPDQTKYPPGTNYQNCYYNDSLQAAQRLGLPI